MKSRGSTPATWVIVFLNVAVFALELSASDSSAILERWALFPERFDGPLSAGTLVTLLSSAFLHAGVVHLAANLTFLIVFGRTVEARLGAVLFCTLYLTGAIASGLAYILADTGSGAAVVGASGAVSAVLGAYLVYFPTSRVRIVVPVTVLFVRTWVPTLAFIGIWLASQVLGLLTPGTNVAWWGHLGGFLFGCFAGLMLKDAPRAKTKRRRLRS